MASTGDAGAGCEVEYEHHPSAEALSRGSPIHFRIRGGVEK
jgi:hypothetical protein